MRFGTTVAAALASLAMASGSTAAAYAGQPSNLPTGNDVSYPQCSGTLPGMTDYFRHIGATVGIYSTPKQWDPIVGTVRPTSPLYRLPDWIPGAKTLAQAKKNCGLVPLTAGGTVSVTQWTTPPTNSDLSCSSLPRPARK
jgi:hypothetical protein